jgi:hypothetical protein
MSKAEKICAGKPVQGRRFFLFGAAPAASWRTVKVQAGKLVPNRHHDDD